MLAIKIDRLSYHLDAISEIGAIWHDVLGKVWMPEIEMDMILSLYHEELTHDGFPLSYVAFYEGRPIGSATLELDGGIRPELGPWLGDVVVSKQYQKNGVGKRLIETLCTHAKNMGFKNLYLFTFYFR